MVTGQPRWSTATWSGVAEVGEGEGFAGAEVGCPVQLLRGAVGGTGDAEEFAGFAAGGGAVDVLGDPGEDRGRLVLGCVRGLGLEYAAPDREDERRALGEPRAEDTLELGRDLRARDPRVGRQR